MNCQKKHFPMSQGMKKVVLMLVHGPAVKLELLS